MFEYAINEPDIWKFNINGGGGKENFEKYFETAINGFAGKKQYPFIVFDKKHNKYAGMTRFYDISEEFNRLDLGFTWYGGAFQGTGLNKNCKYLLLEFAFEKLQVIRVGFGANSKNERSINAMKSIGCAVEGILRQVTLRVNLPPQIYRDRSFSYVPIFRRDKRPFLDFRVLF